MVEPDSFVSSLARLCGPFRHQVPAVDINAETGDQRVPGSMSYTYGVRSIGLTVIGSVSVLLLSFVSAMMFVESATTSDVKLPDWK